MRKKKYIPVISNQNYSSEVDGQCTQPQQWKFAEVKVELAANISDSIKYFQVFTKIQNFWCGEKKNNKTKNGRKQ